MFVWSIPWQWGVQRLEKGKGNWSGTLVVCDVIARLASEMRLHLPSVLFVRRILWNTIPPRLLSFGVSRQQTRRSYQGCMNDSLSSEWYRMIYITDIDIIGYGYWMLWRECALWVAGWFFFTLHSSCMYVCFGYCVCELTRSESSYGIDEVEVYVCRSNGPTWSSWGH